MMGRDSKPTLTLGILGLLAAASARADVAFEVSAGVGHSDNITRVEENEIDETLGSVGLRLDWLESTRHVNGDAQADLSYVEYLQDTYDAEVLGEATGNVDFGIVPERFHWQVEDTFGQARTDPFQPVTPDNRENVNYFSSGPELRLRFGQAMNARVFGRYTNTSYEESPLDAQRVSLGAAVGRELSERSNVALNYVADDSDFEEDALQDYERRSAYLSYELGTGGRTTLNSELGYSWLEMDGEDEDGGLLVDLELTRELTRSSSLTVTASHNFSDTGEGLDAGGGGGSSDITASADPFESTEASLAWNFTRRRTSFGLSTSYEERRYETQTSFDSRTQYYSADFSRQLRPTLQLGVLATWFTEEFINADSDSEDWNGELTLDWRFGRHVGMQLRYELNARSSSAGLGEYSESRIYLGFTFSGDRVPPRGP